MRLVIVGGSGSGKTTQAQRLSQQLNLPLVSAGELRKAIAQTKICHNNYQHPGHYTQRYITSCELIPDKMMIDLMRSHLKQFNIQTGWVLEGYPRVAFQAEELDFLLENLGQELNWAIYLQVPAAVMVKRALGGSLPDDQPEIVQRRIELFYDRTIPILEYYDRRRRLLTINGDQTPEAVVLSIISLISTTEKNY